MFHTVYELSSKVPAEAITNASLGLMKSDITHSSYCSSFKTTLEQMFYRTTLDQRIALRQKSRRVVESRGSFFGCVVTYLGTCVP